MLTELELWRDAILSYVAVPALVIAGLIATVVLRAPQLARFREALRALGPSDKAAHGDTSPSAPVWLAAAASLGAASAVGAATAVALGGAGVLFWVWVLGFVVAPLRYAEVVLARTSAPGRASGTASGSLAARLVHGGGSTRGLGFALGVLLLSTSFAFVGGVHGEAMLDAAGALVPGSAQTMVLGVAVVAFLLAVLGPKRGGAAAGWIALAGIVVIAVIAAVASMTAPGRAIGAIGRAFSEALAGAPEAGPFSGALVGEVLAAAALHAALPLAATTGVDGALHASARAESTRRQAAAAMLAPLAYAGVTTLLVIAFVATGSYFERADATRRLDELTVYGVAFETVSQRLEPERLHDGYMRVIDGEPRDTSLVFGTERGTIRDAHFEEHGRAANFAMQFSHGKPMRFLRSRDGTLDDVDVREAHDVVVSGRMLPVGGQLLASAFHHGTGGDFGGRICLAALLVLLATGAAAMGLGAARSFPFSVPRWATVALATLPALGLALEASGYAPWLSPLGAIAAALTATIAALAIAVTIRQAK